MAHHSSSLAWKIPWTEEPSRLQSMGSLRVGHDWATPFHFSVSCIGEGNGNPVQCSCLENPRYGGALWAAVWGVTHSRTRLKWLSSSSSSSLGTTMLITIAHFHEAVCPSCKLSMISFLCICRQIFSVFFCYRFLDFCLIPVLQFTLSHLLWPVVLVFVFVCSHVCFKSLWCSRL